MIGGPLSVIIRVRRDLATKRSGRTLSRPDNTRRGLERVHELDNRLALFFSEAPTTRAGDGSTSLTLCASPLCAFLAFFHFSALLVSYRPLASSFLGILGVCEAYHASKRCGPRVLHSSSHSVRRGAMAQQQAAAETRG